jgi:hypothetical protein
MTSPNAKCAHEACECVVAPNGPHGKYCSEECRRAGHMTELRCNCQHVECRQAGRVTPPPDPNRITP